MDDSTGTQECAPGSQAIFFGDFRHVVARIIWIRVARTLERRMFLPLSNSNGKFRIMGVPLIVAAIAAVLSAAPGGSLKLNPQDGLTYQWIPPGSYSTGCLPGDTECYGLERHREKISVASGFWIGRTEVTQAAYMRIMNAAPWFYKGANLSANRIGSDRMDGRDRLLQSDRDATAHGVGVGMGRLRRNCRAAEGAGRFPGVVRAKQQ
jgi:hypothetical protein